MKKPFVNKEQLEEIAREFPTPFYLYDELGIRENARRLMRTFSWNPGFREYFALKTAPNPAILQILKEEGCGVDCSSYTELLMAQAVGLIGHSIMFSSNDTPAQDYLLAGRLGAINNLDDYTHIDYLDRLIGIPKVVSCRYNPGGTFEVDGRVVANPGDAKFGMPYEQMRKAFTTLKKRGTQKFGIHSFLTGNTDSDMYYPTLARMLFDVAVRLHEDTGADIRFVNLSGGIGVPYHPDQKAPDIQKISDEIKQAYEQKLTPAGMNDIALFTELGRYMLAPYGMLVTRAIHEKHTYKEYIGVDASMANLTSAAEGQYRHITVLGKDDMPQDHTYDVVGGLCTNKDKFAVDRKLPKIDKGDLLAIHDVGAYGFATGHNFNGKLRSAEVLLCENGEAQLIRRAETPDDYFSMFDFTGMFQSFGKKVSNDR